MNISTGTKKHITCKLYNHWSHITISNMGAKEQLFIDAMYETKYTENTKEKTQHGIQNHDLTQLHGNYHI